MLLFQTATRSQDLALSNETTQGGIEQLSVYLSQHQDEQVILAYEPMRALLAQQLRLGVAYPQAYETLLALAKQLVAAYKAFRQQLSLVPVHAITEEAFENYLHEQGMSSVPFRFGNISSGEVMTPDAYELAAQLAVISDPVLAQAVEQLSACSRFNEYEVQSLSLYAYVEAIQHHEITSLTEKISLEQTHLATQEQLTGLQQQLKVSQAEQASLVEQHQAKLVELHNQIQASQQENELIIEQLHLVQEALEQKLMQLKEQEQHIALAMNEGNKLKHTNDQLNASLKQQAQQLANLTQQIKQSDATQSLLSLENDSLVAENTQFKQQLNALHQQMQQLQQKQQQTLTQRSYLIDELETETKEAKASIMGLENSLTTQRHWNSWLAKQAQMYHAYYYENSWRYRRSLDKKINEIEQSDLFETAWYAQQNASEQPMVKPLLHFMLNGVYSGCNPSDAFNTVDYLLHNPDVAAQGINPFWHYVKFGQFEERNPNPSQKRLPHLVVKAEESA